MVFRVNDTAQYIPQYVFYEMRQQSFFDYMMSGKKGLKMPRGNKDLTMRYQIPVPTRGEQKAIVEKIQKLEQQIENAIKILDSASSRKQTILDKYLL